MSSELLICNRKMNEIFILTFRYARKSKDWEAGYLKGCMHYTQEGMHIEILMLIEALTQLLGEDERIKRQGKIWKHNIKETGRGIES